MELTAIPDVLVYMIEGMYLKKQNVEAYGTFLHNFSEPYATDELSLSEREKFLILLKQELKTLLNEPSTDYEQLMYKYAKHSLHTQAQAKQLFEMIWRFFFPSEDWHISSHDLVPAR